MKVVMVMVSSPLGVVAAAAGAAGSREVGVAGGIVLIRSQGDNNNLYCSTSEV